MRKCCGTCEFNKRKRDTYGNTEFVCDNEESDFYGIPTDYSDYCEEFVEKE